jgi:4'-phosphopantetheinyl transferase
MSPVALPLPTDEIHVWRLAIEPAADPFPGSCACLCSDEVARADRYRFDSDRRMYVIARSALRRILAAYLDRAPGDLAFEYGAAGKPRLRDKCGIGFNLSHSGAACVIAVGRGREVGVDVEKVRPLPGSDEIARRFLSPAEWQSLMEMPDGQRQDAFFRRWVRMEAVAKATGQGITARPAEDWVVRDLNESTTASGVRYVGAVAARGDDWRPCERNIGDIDLD